MNSVLPAMKNPLRFLATRPARWSIFGFRFVPLLLFAAGTCAILYGGFFHRMPITETHDEEFTVAEPIEPDMPPGMGMDSPMFPGMDPNMDPGMPEEPPVKFVTKIKTVETVSNELEWDVNILMTYDGIVRNDRGELFRPAASTEGPGFCPT